MKNIIITGILIFGIALTGFAPQTPTAKEIVERAEKKLRGESSIADVTIQIIRPNWDREIQTKTWALGSEYALILIKSPARDKGTVFLKRDNEIWNWQPSIQRQIKMPPSMMMQSWMGSDFTNDDLVRESSIIVDYNHKIVGDSTIEGRTCYKIELIPKPDAPVVWGKIISFISSDGEYLQMRGEFYDEDGFLINTLQASDIVELSGRLLPQKLTMTPADQPGHSTIMTYNNIEFNADLEEEFFSVQNMKRIR
jgi:outer membrane lipoprotein-sorting protein